MSSRGAVILNGHFGTDEYRTIYVTDSGAKILEGNDKKHHSLPDYAHTPNSVYVKMKYDGVTLHEMRFYDDERKPIIEIAYHPEPKINNGSRGDIVHFHIYHGLDRDEPIRMDEHPEIKQKYAKYLKEFGLYDLC